MREHPQESCDALEPGASCLCASTRKSHVMLLSQEHHACARAPAIVSRSKADLRRCLRMGTHDDDADALVPYTIYTRKASNASACVATQLWSRMLCASISFRPRGLPSEGVACVWNLMLWCYLVLLKVRERACCRPRSRQQCDQKCIPARWLHLERRQHSRTRSSDAACAQRVAAPHLM